jgi:AcrR family transcriptional regulator
MLVLAKGRELREQAVDQEVRTKLTDDLELKPKRADTGSTAQPRRRVKRAERERQIIDEAIKFFAEVGFGGDVRELARRIGVNQSVLYRFFDNKDALIERVYQEVFVTSWNPFWDETLENRSVPLLDRLVEYYVQYSHNVITYEWVRILLFAGLRGENLNRRFVEFMRERVSTRVVKEIRAELGLPTDENYQISDLEFELVSGIHADIFYLGVRKWVYGMSFPDDLDQIVEAKVIAFFDGVPGAIQRYSAANLK